MIDENNKLSFPELKYQVALTFDDVLLEPCYSEVLPKNADIRTKLTKKININCPLLSAAMDTVTMAKTAIAMARHGGIGIIHRNLPPKIQAEEVETVKKSENGMISNPKVVYPDTKVKDVLDAMSRYSISGVPVVQSKDSMRIEGIVTNRDLRFVTEEDYDKEVKEFMTTKNLISFEYTGKTIPIEKAIEKLHNSRKEKLLVLDANNYLKGIITIKDIQKSAQYPDAAKDKSGSLMVGACVGVGDLALERARLLIEKGADLLVVDSAHGHSKNVIDMVKNLKREFPNTEVIAGNVATSEGVSALYDAGADAVKVGVGPGSICTTRIIAGVGVPQMTAIMDCAAVGNKLGVPIVADGGIRNSGDIVKSLAGGASSVMLGSVLAGTEETPGDVTIYQGRTYKVYRGMGSIEAMRDGSADRYGQSDKMGASKLIPEGIVGRVPYRGSIYNILFQLCGGLKSGMGYIGASTIKDLQKRAKFVICSPSSLRESHVHDVDITSESLNYSGGRSYEKDSSD
jgi:IMP dehydrogenase